jgi:hypothetical protein
MTFQSQRIYTYKITFEEVPYYYYGVHKEKKFDEYYMGSPYTNKWCWELYTPKKQILQFFDFTDEGWLEANLIENRLIKPFYNTDKWCLNENCGGNFSLKISRETGEKHKKFGIGVCGRSPAKMSEDGRKGGLMIKELKLGIFALTPEKKTERSRKAGLKNKKNNTGIFSLTTEQLRENAKKAYEFNRKNNTGIFSLTTEQLSENAKKTNRQKWMCLETGYVSNAGGLSHYQKVRGIDTSRRKRVA